MGEIKHAVQRTASVMGVLTVVFLIGLGLYMGYITFVKPHFNPSPTTTQTAEEITNIEIYNPEDSFFLGVRMFGLKFGITKPIVKRIKEITEEVEK